MSYKTKRIVIAVAAAVVLFTAAATGTYFYIKGNESAQAKENTEQVADQNNNSNTDTESNNPASTSNDKNNGQPTGTSNRPVDNVGTNATNNGTTTTRTTRNDDGTTTRTTTNADGTTTTIRMNTDGTTTTTVTNPDGTIASQTTDANVITETEESERLVSKDDWVGWSPEAVPVPVIARIANDLSVNKYKLNILKEVISTDANEDGQYDIGETITYRITVSNIGNTKLEGIKVSDRINDREDITKMSKVDDNNTLIQEIENISDYIFDLDAGEKAYFEYSYTVKEEDIVAGAIQNSATATNDKVEEKTTITTETEEVNEDYTVTKVADKKIVKVGDIVTYTITVTNTGNVTLKDLTVKDEMINLDTTVTIAVGEVKEFTGTYTVTQDDIDAQKVITNTVYVGDVPTTEDITPEPENKNYTVTKVADKKIVKAGDTVTYTITVKNTGNVTLNNVKVDDEMINLHEEVNGLAPNEETSFTGTYTVTQEDIDSQKVITNTVTVGDKTTTEEITPEPENKDYTVTKVADKKIVKAGDIVTYTITVTNTGNVTLKDLTVKDEMIKLDTTVTLAVGEVKEFTGTYKVTQEDIDAQKVITNTVTVGDVPTTEDITPEPENKNYTVTKVADKKIVKAGDVVTYTITVTNTGNVTLKDLTVKDEMIKLDTTVTLAVGEVKEFTGTYTVTQEDIDAQKVITNTVTVGDVPTTEDITPEPENKNYTVTKVADKKIVKAGDIVTYTITVTNTGNVTLKDLTVKDEMIKLDTTVTLAVGEVKEFTGTYKVTQEDIDAQKVITNTVYVGDVPTTEDITPEPSNPAMEIIKDGTITTKGQNNQMTDFVEVGDIITYTVSARNTGNVTLKDVVIKDETMKDLDGNVPTATVSLAPSEEFTKVLEFKHLVTADDIVLGSDGKAYVYNQATATANNPNNPEEPVDVEPADNKEEARKEYSYRVEYYYDEILDDSKTESDLPANLGDIITQYTDKVIDGYKFDRVTPVDGNGNVSLPITVNENDNVIKVYYNKRTDLSYTVNYLEKGTNKVLADPKQVGGKTFKSTVTEEAIDIEGYEKVDPTSATITIEVSGNVINFYYEKIKNLEIEKTASVTTANVGDTITYTIKVTNENSTAKETTITDTLPEGITVDTSSITDGGSISSDGKQIIWSNISIPPTGKTITYNVKVNDNMIGKTLTNNVKVSNLGEDSDSSTVEVNELNVSKTEVKPGETGKDSANIVLVMDLSYSMADKDVTGSDGKTTSRINAAKDAVTQFIKKIYEEDGKPTNSKATITVITFNTKDPIHKNDVVFVTQNQLNRDYYDDYRYDHDYYSDSNNLDNNYNTIAYYIAGETEETVPYTGTSVLGNANKDNYKSLINLVNNITLPEKNPTQPLYNQNGMGTHIRAGMDLAQTTIEQLETTQPNNKNVVILLSDGQPSDYDNNSPTDISKVVNGQNGIKNEPADFYSIGFGAEASDSSSNAYNLLAQLSSDNKVYTSNSAIELVENFTNILDEIGTKDLDTDDGVVKIDVSTQLVVSSEYPIVVKYKDNELFTFTSMDEVNNNDYGFSYNSSTKQIVWDINVWNSKITDSEGHNITHVTSSKDTSIAFYAERVTNSQTGRRLLSRAMNISDENELIFNEMVKYNEVMPLEENKDQDENSNSSNKNKENINDTTKKEVYEVKTEINNETEANEKNENKAEVKNENKAEVKNENKAEVKNEEEVKENFEETKTQTKETEEKYDEKVAAEKEDTNSTETKEVTEKGSNTADTADTEVSEEPTE